MLLRKLHENYDALMQIGKDAEEAGRSVGIKPSWASQDKPADPDKTVHELEPCQPVTMRR